MALSLAEIYILRIIGTLLCVMITVQSFKVTHLELPSYLDPREWSELVCRYDPGDKKLMVLRWLREEEELIRYMTKSGPNLQIQVYNTSWLNLERGQCVSNACSLRILAIPGPYINTNTTTKFRCEISSEPSDSFLEDSKEDVVGYASPPRVDPTIIGLPEFVEVGDQIRLNCSTDFSWPAPEITWYINDHLVRTNASKVGSVNETFLLETHWDVLEFVVTEEDLAGGASLKAGRGASPDDDPKDSAGVLSVRCQSSVEQFGKSRSTEHTLQTRSHALTSSLSSGSNIGLTEIWKILILTILLK